MNLSWKKLLSSKTLIQRTTEKGQKGRDSFDGRSSFDSDYDRIIFSYPFRRLQDKAQLFPLESNDFVRTRLTHSLEVAALAKSMGISIAKKLSENENLYDWLKSYENDLPKVLECAGLVHDLGNPPFGHFGEKVIGDNLTKILESLKENLESDNVELLPQQKSDLEKFEGNSQSFRILTHIQCIKDGCGYHMTSTLLASIIKYPVDSVKGNVKDSKDVRLHKFGYFFTENETVNKVFENTGLIDCKGNYIRHPLTFILEAADDLAYCAGDIEDGFKKHLFSIEELINCFEEYNKNINDIKIWNLTASLRDIFNDDSYYSEEKKVQAIRIAIQQVMFHSIIKCFFENYNQIMSGSFSKELIETSDVCELRNCLKEITKKYLFSNNEVIAKEILGRKVISELVKLYADGLFKIYEMDGNKKKFIKFDERTMKLISSDYLTVFKKTIGCNDSFDNIEINGDNIYYILLLIADQISGMTDNYCLSLYRKLNGI